MFSFLSYRQIKKHRKKTEPKKVKPQTLIVKDEDGKVIATITMEGEK